MGSIVTDVAKLVELCEEGHQMVVDSIVLSPSGVAVHGEVDEALRRTRAGSATEVWPVDERAAALREDPQ